MYIPELRRAFNRWFGGKSEPEPANATDGESTGGSGFTRPGWTGLGRYPDLPGYPLSQTVSTIDGVEVVPAVNLCISIYADTLCDLPKFVRRKTSPRERLDDHWLTRRINDPHPGLNGQKLWRWVGREIAARGESYVVMTRDSMGFPLELCPARLQSSPVGIGQRIDAPGSVVQMQVPPDPAYYADETGLGGGRGTPSPVGFGGPGIAYGGQYIVRPYRSEDILHFTDADYDPFVGQSPNPLLCRAKNPIGLYHQIWNRYTQRLAGGGHDTVYFTMPESEDEWSAFLTRFEKNAAGIRNAGRPFPLPFGSDVKSLTVTDVQRETLGMLQFLVIDIARAWGIPPFMIFARLGEGVSARARSDLAEQFLNFQRLRYAAFVKSITAEMDAKILRPLAAAGRASARNVCVEFDLDHMTMGTFEGRSKIAVSLHAGGLLTKNEARALVDFERIDGGDELPQVRGAPAEPERRGTSLPDDEPNEPAEDRDRTLEVVA